MLIDVMRINKKNMQWNWIVSLGWIACPAYWFGDFQNALRHVGAGMQILRYVTCSSFEGTINDLCMLQTADLDLYRFLYKLYGKNH